MRFSKHGLLAGALGAGMWLGAAGGTPAQACGGLFCSSANPVNQAAERIVSYDQAAKKVTAVVEILYAGPSEHFAWVLPVPGIPEVGVSTSALLDQLQQITNPTYSINRMWGGTCGDRGALPPTAQPGSNAGGTATGPGGSSVAVLAAGNAGPYDYEVIQVVPGMADAAVVALNWLAANHYDVGALGADVLRPYLRDGLNLLAVRLAKNKNQMTGSIRPIMLTYDATHPMIPIRPTAVAANDDMGILAFVLGKSRAVPTNYKSLELNEAMIDWFQPNVTYNAVVTSAANEAMGQGFVTEMAGTTGMGSFASNLYNEQGNVQQFRSSADAMAPAALIVQMIESFSTYAQGNFGGPFTSRPAGGRVALDGVADVLADQLKLPAGVTADMVVASPRCYFAELRQPGAFYCDGKTAPTATIDLTTFNKTAFLTDVEKLVIAPMEKTAKLFVDQPYLTRFYTTMSAGEMTLDPEFDLNNELGDVANAHVLDLKYTTGCPGDTSGPWEATVGGLIVRGQGNTWPVNTSMDGVMPFNRRIVQLGTTGLGTMITDNTAVIAKALGGSQPAMPTPGVDGGAPGGASGGADAGASASGSSGGGCSFAGTGGSGAVGGSLLLGGLLAVLRRRRR